MALRVAACAVTLAWACCTGCSHTQSAPTAQTPPPPKPSSSLSAQFAPVVDQTKFILQSDDAFFARP